MLRYLMLIRKRDSVVYEIHPEGDAKAAGQIELFDDGTFGVLKEVGEAYNNSYVGHAVCGIDRDTDEGVLVWH